MFVKCFLLRYNSFGGSMFLIKNEKKIEVKYYHKFFQKAIGFMFQKKKNYAIYFKNCNSIHTFFCFFPLDIYFLDKNDNILYAYHEVGKNRIFFPQKNVKNVLEVPSSIISDFTIKRD